MGWGRRNACAVALAVAALLGGLVGAARDAVAYTAAGDRVFPATLVLPQFAPGDEFYLWADALPLTPAGDGSGSRQSNVTAVLDKTITPRLGLVVEETWTRLDRVGHGAWSGMQNLDTELKYLAIDDPAHEFIATVGIDREFGGTGAVRVGAFAAGATTPRLYLAKGLGDLDIGWLRPIAVGGLFGYQIADAAPRPNLFTPGVVVEYSIPYLESKVVALPLGEFFRHLTPMTEVRFQIPSGASFGARTTALIAPGVSYAGPGWELAAEALIPATRASGRGVGVIAQLHVSLDYLFPETLGRPLFAAP